MIQTEGRIRHQREILFYILRKAYKENAERARYFQRNLSKRFSLSALLRESDLASSLLPSLINFVYTQLN